MNSGYGMGTGGVMMFLSDVNALVLIGVVIWVMSRAAAPQQSRGETPEEILRQRYARGDVSREQFDQMRDDLRR